jgi:tryptophanyl-tRNA synthetase
MRPTGRLHLGHYHGVLKNWVQLQSQYECFFFVADWHALTTHYEDPHIIEESVWDMVVDWLAAGVDPNNATLFIQSRIPAHAELHVLLSMITPLSWLERVPSYKDQQLQLGDRDLSTYGFLGYPLLQSADILIYRAGMVPVGEDQVAHVELTREVARRFNHLYGREPGYEQLAEEAIKKMGKKNAKLYRELRTAYMEQGDREALETARALLERQKNIALGDKERLFGFLEGGGKIILPEPQAMLTHAPKMPGLDGARCPNLMTTSSVCAIRRRRWKRSSAPCPPTRRACIVPTRETRTNARCGIFISSTRTRKRRTGCKTAAVRRKLAALNANSPSLMPCWRN